MPRVENWPRGLEDAVKAAHATPFEWGVHDCCLMAANIIREITGIDPAESLRGTYSTAEEAAAIIAAAGGLDALVQGITSGLGWPRTRPSSARRGDLVLFTSPVSGQPALGICLGRDACFPGIPDGLSFIKTAACSAAWRVE